jgi:hypothetical protein
MNKQSFRQGDLVSLKEESKQILSALFGPEVARQVETFEDPEKYPKDFLDECTYFLGKFVGESAAKGKFKVLYKKYIKTAKKGEANEAR